MGLQQRGWQHVGLTFFPQLKQEYIQGPKNFFIPFQEVCRNPFLRDFQWHIVLHHATRTGDIWGTFQNELLLVSLPLLLSSSARDSPTFRRKSKGISSSSELPFTLLYYYVMNTSCLVLVISGHIWILHWTVSSVSEVVVMEMSYLSWCPQCLTQHLVVSRCSVEGTGAKNHINKWRK